MKANYEEDKVIVSATEPTGVNRKKVWFKKGKNSINIKEALPGTLRNNTGEYMNTRSTIENITDNSVTFKLTSNWAGVVFFINVLPNTTYTLKFDSTIAEITGNVNDNYVLIDTFNNETYKRRAVQKSGTTHSFTTQENENEVRICIETGNTSALNINITLSNIQLEQGITATDYEQYIEPEIYILNNNNVYEKMYSNSIIENGENEYFKYIKFSDGTLIQYGTMIFNNLTWNPWGGLYNAECNVSQYKFPVPFICIPVVNGSIAHGTDSADGLISRIGGTSTTDIESLAIARPTTYTKPIYVNIIAIGRWK